MIYSRRELVGSAIANFQRIKSDFIYLNCRIYNTLQKTITNNKIGMKCEYVHINKSVC